MDEQGRALLNQERVEEGLRLVDEVLVIANSGKLSPIITGIVYCNTIAFCRSVYQLHHARDVDTSADALVRRTAGHGRSQRSLSRPSRRNDAAAGRMGRRVGRGTAGVDTFHTRCLEPACVWEGVYRQAEVHRLRGEFYAAEQAYREASRCGSEPQPGLALLRLAQGNADPAVAAIRRAVSEATAPMSRAALLPAYIEIMLAVGELAEAASACRELEGIAEGRGSDALTAMSAHASGAVALARGRCSCGLVRLRRASGEWQKLEAPYEGARTRVLVGLACRLLGDEETALLEFEAAQGIFAQLGAKSDLARIDSHSPRVESSAAHGLTARELEVLRLVAAGKSNHAIAAELWVSDHTIRRHLQNIFRKLGVSSRAAATAFAFQHDLM